MSALWPFIRQVSGSTPLRLTVLSAIYALFILVALQVSFFLGFDEMPWGYYHDAWRNVAWYIPFKLCVLFAFGQYRGVLFYFRLPDLIRIVGACVVSGFLMGVLYVFYQAEGTFPRRVIVGETILSAVLLSAFRMSLRVYRERVAQGNFREPRTRLAIFGADDDGEALSSQFFAKRGLGRLPVLFFDDDPRRQGRTINGLEVRAFPSRIERLREDYRINEIVIASSAISQERIRQISETALQAGIEVVTVPSALQMVTGRFMAEQVRPIELGDLLHRPPVDLDSEQISAMLRGRSVLVTGAGGSIGAELCRHILRASARQLICVDHAEGSLFQIEQDLLSAGFGDRVRPVVANICDEARIQQILEHFRPDLVFHAAAHKHVPMLEEQPGEAFKNNSMGTLRLAEKCAAAGVERFVLISTDKAINPTSAMGASKRLAEILMQAFGAREKGGTKFMAVRFGNVLGSSGSVVPTFERQIAQGGPVTVTHPEVTRYFMTIPEAVGLVLQSVALGEGGEIFVLDMGEPMKIVDLARALIRLKGLEPDEDIEIVFTGLRPGEKLFEELQYSREGCLRTAHGRVFRLCVEASDFSALLRDLDALAADLYLLSAVEIKQRINAIVPEYTPYFGETADQELQEPREFTGQQALEM